jgi:hypothetical protein
MAIGSTPMIAAMVVIMMGRKRIRQASKIPMPMMAMTLKIVMKDHSCSRKR